MNCRNTMRWLTKLDRPLLVTLLAFLLALGSLRTEAQYCAAATTNTAITVTAVSQNTASFNSGVRAFNFTTVAGNTYFFATCGLSTGDTYLRLYSTGTAGTVLASNDDGCSPQSTFSYLETVSTTRSVLVTDWSCANLTTATQVSYYMTAPITCTYTVPGTGNNSITTCSGTICDPAGTGNYVVNQDGYTVINPSIGGNMVRIVGTSSAGEGCCDYVQVYDGVGTGAPSLGQYFMNTAIPTLTSTVGPLTIRFVSDVSVVGAGFSATISCVPPSPPANDLICNATAIPCGGSIGGSTLLATATGTAETTDCSSATSDQPSVWYKVTGNGQIMTASLCATAWDSQIAVFSGTCAAPVCVGGVDDNGPSCAGTPSSITWTSVNATQYWIRVNGFNTNSAFTLGLTCTNAPVANDACAGAALVPVAANLGACVSTLVTTGSTQDGPNATCSGTTGNVPDDDVWYRFVAPLSGNKVIMTTTSGTSTDMVMQVWDGCGANLLGCDDDGGVGLMPELQLCGYTPGATYYIRLWTYAAGGSGLTGNLCVYEDVVCPPPPGNDQCGSATALTIGTCPANQVAGTTVNATAGIDPSPTCEAFAAKNDVWYTVTTGPCSASMTVTVTNTGVGLAEWALFSGYTCVTGGTQLACTNGAGSSLVSVTPNTIYHIRIWSNPGAATTFTVCAAETTVLTLDTDGDLTADCADTDDDNDGVLDGPDTADLNPDVCADADGDGCDDCSQNGGSFAAGANNFPANDGTDTDSDGQCNFTDADDDNDGTSDAAEITCGSDPLNAASTCEVCDGADNDLDTFIDEGFANLDGDADADCVDTDDDNDGVADATDPDDTTPDICGDADLDGCDDCSVGTDNLGPVADNLVGNDGADFDGDGLCDFGDPDDDNDGLTDVQEGVLGTDPFDTDTDNDSFGDATDTCPTVFGQIGSVCDAQAGPGYTLGQLNGACTCQAVPCTNTLNLVFNPDGVTDIGWELREAGTNTLVQSGGGVYPATPEYSLATCLPNGSFYLVVTSDQVGGGIVQGGVQGGYRLETTGGVRLVDNRNNFLSGATSTIAGGLGFDLPAGVDRLVYTSCDKLDWRTNEYIVANDNPAVAAYYGGANAAVTGYEMWFYDPNGGYSFRRFHSHAVSDGFAPANAQRACHIKINGWGGVNTIPAQSNLLNVKVRGRVMVGLTPTNLAWGPACRFKMDANRAQCPLTQLMDVPGSTQLSCGATRAIGSGGANLVHARPVNRYLGGVSTAANRYQFRFRIPAEFVVIDKTSATSQYWVNTIGLAPCKTYKVEVRASFDNGVTWCDTYAPANPNPYSPLWGRTCDLTTSGCAVGGGNQNMATDLAAGINLYPNPNNGEQLFLSIDMIQAGVEKVSMDIYDSFGKRVSANTIAVNEGFVNTSVDLKGSLAAGMYIVNITAGDAVYTERLVIQP